VTVLSVAIGSSTVRAAPPVLPLCAISVEAQQQVDRLWGRTAAAVSDLRSGDTWAGGDQRYRFTLHSTAKAVLAFAALEKLEQVPQPPPGRLTQRLRRMVVLGENEAADKLFAWLGGASALADFYRRIGASNLSSGVHDRSWGLGTARAAALARMLGRLDRSPVISEQARTAAVDLLKQTPAALHWRAYSVYALPDWTAAAKSGWFWLDDDSQRINLVALLYDESGRARYAMVLLYEGFARFDQVWEGFNAVIGWLAHDLSLRETGRPYGERGCVQAARFLRQLGVTLDAVP